MISIQSIYGKDFSQKVMLDNFNLISLNLKTLDNENGFFVNTIDSSFINLKTIEKIKNNKEQYLKILVNFLSNAKEIYS